MKKSDVGADGSLGLPLGERVVWDTDSPDHECDCPGPPPQFYLPPPPRPSSDVDSGCSENSVPQFKICESVPVIDAEYQYSPAVQSLAIILTVASVVVVFLLIGTFLVVIKKKKLQNLFPRKSSLQNRFDGAPANGVIYEDLTSIRPQTVSAHCPPGQTTLPSMEMTDIASYPDRDGFPPAFGCPASPLKNSSNSQELFNPVYEELSNESEERGDSDSEGMLDEIAISEDEFAEDERSLGGDAEIRPEAEGKQNERSFQGFANSDAGADFSEADDRSEFLRNIGRNSSFTFDHWSRGRRTASREPHNRDAAKKPKSLNSRKIWKNRAPTSLPAPSVVDCNEFHEGFLIKKILQIYPDVTGMGLQYSQEPSVLKGLESHPPESFSLSSSRRSKPEIFSTFRAKKSSEKNQSQDSSFCSDSGYSNNTSGGKSSSRTRKEYAMTNHSNPVVS